MELYSEGEIDRAALTAQNAKLRGVKTAAQAELDKLTKAKADALQKAHQEKDVHARLHRTLMELRDGRVTELADRRRLLGDMLGGERLVITYPTYKRDPKKQKGPGTRLAKEATLTIPAWGPLPQTTLKLGLPIAPQMLGGSLDAIRVVYNAEDDELTLGSASA